jgi:hypothetical protein
VIFPVPPGRTNAIEIVNADNSASIHLHNQGTELSMLVLDDRGATHAMLDHECARRLHWALNCWLNPGKHTEGRL